uniref:Amino acid transporter n=1 Tax=Psilocybe cubensis TaxID=181762 RepID=A0A8H8CKT5_PSICU
MRKDDVEVEAQGAGPNETTSLLSDVPITTLDEFQAIGAPVERSSVLGREVTLLSAIMLNIGQITGSGIFAVPGVILNSVGSVGVLLLYWILTPIFAYAGISLYSEFASMFPNRSGAEVVYLEQAYPRPRFLVSTAFAATAILTSFSASNSIVFAQYTLSAFNVPITAQNQTVTALAMIFVTIAFVAFSTKWSLRVVNFLTVFKVLSLVFIVATGLAVLLGLTRIEDPYANFHNLFEGTSWNPNSLATAFVKSNHAFVGYNNAFNVLGEVRSKDPVKTVRRAGIISLLSVSVLFLFINIAYVAAVPQEDIRNSGQLIAVLFFQRVFGTTGARVFPLFVAASCFGNIIAVTIGHTRVIREVARQGLLPYPGVFTSIRPFGTPLGPIALKGLLTVLVIVAIPARDAFNFVLDLASYPSLVFNCALALGLWALRRRRALANIKPPAFQAKNSIVALYLTSCVLLLLMPWVPPEPGHADVSFWYATLHPRLRIGVDVDPFTYN